MAALRKFDVAVTLEAAGFSITDNGLTFFLDEDAETFAAAWREVNCARNAILDAFDRAGPDADRQLDAAMEVVHDLLLSIGIERREPASAPALAFDADVPAGIDNNGIRTPESLRAPALHNRALIQRAM